MVKLKDIKLKEIIPGNLTTGIGNEHNRVYHVGIDNYINNSLLLADVSKTDKYVELDRKKLRKLIQKIFDNSKIKIVDHFFDKCGKIDFDDLVSQIINAKGLTKWREE